MAEYKCPECGFTGINEEWDEAEVYCEECGTHSAFKCPQCKEVYDSVWDRRIIIDKKPFKLIGFKGVKGYNNEEDGINDNR